MSARPLALALLALVAAPGTALAGDGGGDPITAFADAVKDATGDYSQSWVITKMTTFKLGAKCAAKLADKNQGAVHAATFYTRDIGEYAKGLTGEDWSAIESQNNNDRETNKPLVEKAMNAFAPRLSVTVTVEGDDCDAKQNSLWLKYWGTIATALRNFPPKAETVAITLDVKSKAKDVTVVMGKDGSTFAITAPKDIEVAAWGDKIEKPFRKLMSELPDDFSFALKESTGHFYSAWVLTKLHTFKLGKKCTARLASKDEGAVHAASFATRDIVQYAKDVGAGDWDAVENQSANDPKTNRDLVGKDMDAFRSRLSIAVQVDGDDCDAKQNSLWLRYWTTIATALRDYPPKANKVAIKLVVTAKAKDVSVKAGKNGASFTITAPRDKEVAAWTDKIVAPFKANARKPQP